MVLNQYVYLSGDQMNIPNNYVPEAANFASFDGQNLTIVVDETDQNTGYRNVVFCAQASAVPYSAIKAIPVYSSANTVMGFLAFV
jgi:hypothetical protein